MQKIEDSHGTDIMEQVYPRIAWIEGKEIPVARVLFYPSFIRPGSRITHVFEDTAELILGRRRTGILEIIPTLIRRSENIVLDTDKTTHVSFEQGILGIFPKLAAGTRWLHFDIWPDYGPSFTMLYSAFPIPYSRAKRVPVFS
ncbi:MAG TPA: hypothetical protein VJB96_00630 [Patescibacteria group bacterium]|nr:hypothetical protein [Patescibacteria group bacterium]